MAQTLRIRSVRKQHIPIEGMVPDLSSIVKNASLSGLDQLLQRSTSLRQQVVEIIYITTNQADPRNTTSGGVYHSDSQ